MEPSEFETMLVLALSLGSLSLVLNIVFGVALFMVTKSHAEKIGLLSHVAGHYLNVMEQEQTKKKLVTTRQSRNAKVTNGAFLERSAR